MSTIYELLYNGKSMRQKTFIKYDVSSIVCISIILFDYYLILTISHGHFSLPQGQNYTNAVSHIDLAIHISTATQHAYTTQQHTYVT